MLDQSPSCLPVPPGWPSNVKSAVLHVVALAHYALLSARGWAADALNPRARQAAENDQLKQEIQLLCEELRIKTARIAKIDPRHRPFYPPTERMAILELEAARGPGMVTRSGRPCLPRRAGHHRRVAQTH